MKKSLLFILSALSWIITYGQTSTYNSTLIIGKNMVTNADIEAAEYVFPERIYHANLDTLTHSMTLQLRELTKNGKYLKNKGEVVAFDLKSKKIKWTRKNDFDLTGVEQYENVMLHTSIQNTARIDMETGKDLWTTDNIIYTTIPSLNISLGYKYFDYSGMTTKLEGIDLSTGQSLWTRNINNAFGWNGTENLNDTAILIRSGGLHQINLKTGAGWDYEERTGKRDYSGAIITNIAGIAIGLLSGTFMFSSKHDLISDLASNVLIDSTYYYFASRDHLTCLSRDGHAVWKTDLPKETSQSEILENDSNVFMINYGKAEFNNSPCNYGKPFISSFNKETGVCNFMTKLDVKNNPVLDFITDSESVILMFKDHLTKYSLRNGLKSEDIYFDTKDVGTITSFIPKSNYYLQNDSIFNDLQTLDPSGLYGLTSKNKLLKMNTKLELNEVIALDSVYFKTLETDNFKLLYINNNTFIIDKNNFIIGELNIGNNLFCTKDKIYEITDNSIIEIEIKQLYPN